MHRRLCTVVAAMTLVGCATGPKTDYAAEYNARQEKYEAMQAARVNFATASSDVVRDGVRKLSSKFDAGVEYAGPIMCLEEYPSSTMKDPHCDVSGVRYSLVSLGEGKTRIFVLASFVYNNRQSWAFYDSASLEGGAQLNLADVDRQVGSGFSPPSSGYLGETVQVMLPLNYVEKKSESGFDIRFNARRPRNFDVLHIPSEYIKGFLSAIPAK